MKQPVRGLPALAAAALLFAAAALPAGADSAVRYEAVPDAADIATGDSVTLSIRCAEADLDPAGAALTFRIGEGYVFTDARDGSDITAGELSYSYQEGQLVLLYLDTAAGGSPVTPGQEIATVTLQAAQAGSGEPMTCTKVDSSAVDADGNVVSQAGTLDMGTVEVTGETVALPTAAPTLVEEGQAADPSAVTAPASPSDPAAPSDPADPSAPADAGGSQPAGQSAAAQSGQAAGGAPAPTPYFTTDPDGQRVQVVPESTPAPLDRTEEVLAGQPATTPAPTPTPVGGGAAGVPAVLAAVLGALIVGALLVVLVKVRSRKY